MWKNISVIVFGLAVVVSIALALAVDCPLVMDRWCDAAMLCL